MADSPEQEIARFLGRLARAGLDDETAAAITARAFPEYQDRLLRGHLTAWIARELEAMVARGEMRRIVCENGETGYVRAADGA